MQLPLCLISHLVFPSPHHPLNWRTGTGLFPYGVFHPQVESSTTFSTKVLSPTVRPWCALDSVLSFQSGIGMALGNSPSRYRDV